jgi:alpha-1,3-mannosyltransferase
MNMLLYAPGVLLVLLIATGLQETFICLSICAAVQLVLGYPFLSTFPVEYLTRSFDVKRVFMYKWTVNLKFLPENIFVGKQLSVLLLVLTLIGKTGGNLPAALTMLCHSMLFYFVLFCFVSSS